MADDPQDEFHDVDDALAAEQAAVDDIEAETVEFVSELESGGDAPPSLEEQVKALEDRNLRLQAELQNVLGRARRESEETRKYGSLGVARDLLPALDNIDRALEAAEKAGQSSDPTSTLADGFRMVRDQIAGALAQHGCQLIDTAPGTEFDPSMHEAILQQPSPDHPAGTILLTAQPGYKLHDRVVRAAQVVVSSGPAA
ncbi:nucleotide exchange factor GrpE [Botrimarina mediterranea]|uniref:Protein GrpE n=1 Tax=Botrimarina mediterranea TaxID=2528022 RepID=A0A518K4G5_9BACT|nr:nucleotide exchange factor GrpE [Botrimarina mediterranea]QDV72655.1 heat shock protein GrpE [Botrimarina mediterranea]QDV77227.1 heat shock protein GrpE [Planctomycetes bacterium K2D]CAE7557719.1 grpE [Symbiodinium sp. CCMP2456]